MSIFYDVNMIILQMEWWHFIVAPLFLVAITFIIVVVIALIMNLNDYAKDKEFKILPSYIKAKKNKICPLIEYDEEAGD